MVPSTPTFSPSKYIFNSIEFASQKLNSNDGVLQANVLDGCSVFVEGVKVPQFYPAVQVNGFWLTHEIADKGELNLLSWTNQEREQSRKITAEFNITKIEFRGVTYYPANY